MVFGGVGKGDSKMIYGITGLAQRGLRLVRHDRRIAGLMFSNRGRDTVEFNSTAEREN